MPESINYKKLFKENRISPSEFFRLEAINHQKILAHRYADQKIIIHPCKCRSAFCKKCAISSPTNKKIQEYMKQMDYKKVRHIILTCSKSKTPNQILNLIRDKRAIPKMLYKMDLKGRKYLWVIEFHADGRPHWHLFIENIEAMMIGHKNIKWQHGIFWESYIKDANHWQAIIGYSKKKGYIACETKTHQLELPEVFKEMSRIRKFGTNIKTDNNKKTKTEPDNSQKQDKPKRKKRTYSEMFKNCDKESSIIIEGANLSLKIKENSKAIIKTIEDDTRASKSNYNEFLCSSSNLPDILDSIISK